MLKALDEEANRKQAKMLAWIARQASGCWSSH